MITRKRIVAAIAAIVAGLGIAAVVAPASALAGTAVAQADDGHSRILLVTYRVQKECTIHANYPLNPSTSGYVTTWKMEPGAKIVWRYNVTSKIAAVADPGRPFPHWGFVEDSSCIGLSTGQTATYHGHKITFPAGRPVPKRIKSGRSQHKNKAGEYWRTVDWHPAHGAIPSAHRTLGHTATLRDAPNAFVIGNVFPQWEIRPSTQSKNGYTEVYVPALHRWGWLQL
jgi:hypothetical protein